MQVIDTLVNTYNVRPEHISMPQLKNVNYIEPFTANSNNGVTCFNDCNGRSGYIIQITIKTNKKIVKTAMCIHNRLSNDKNHVIYFGPNIIYNGKYVKPDHYYMFFDIINDLLYGKQIHVFDTNGVIHTIEKTKKIDL